MSIAIEILKQDSLNEIKTHAQALASRRDDLAAQLVSRKAHLQQLRQKLIDNGLSTDDRVSEINAWLTWIEEAIAAMTSLNSPPRTLV